MVQSIWRHRIPKNTYYFQNLSTGNIRKDPWIQQKCTKINNNFLLQELLTHTPSVNDIPVRLHRSRVNNERQMYNDHTSRVDRDLRYVLA